MLPTAADVKVKISDALPAEAEAVVVLGEGGEFAVEVSGLTEAGLFDGKIGSVVTHLSAERRRLIVVGLGTGDVTAEQFRKIGGGVAKAVAKLKVKRVALLGAADPAAVVTGMLLKRFEYREYKGSATTEKSEEAALRLTMVGDYSPAQQAAIEQAVVVAEAQNFARTIATRPGNDINPVSLAKVAEKLAEELGIKSRVLDEKEMTDLGMGGILGVGAGSSATPPRMIVLEYRPKKSPKKNGRTLLVVGKAITFDTGGISIKPAASMQKMVFDKCGGMAVLGLMYAVAKLKLSVNVVGILAAAENHISETAYRPGDILRMYNGVTVEVTNTDAEGRLVLGDALAWGIETYKPAAVVDLATLTGGVVVALGKTMAGVMSNDDGLVEQLQHAANLSGEKIWRLPIGDDQRDLLKSEVADIVNSGVREAHPLQGGAFLSYFLPKAPTVPWAHLDIAGVADTEKDLPYYGKGATGWGVRTLVEWVIGFGQDTVDQMTPPPAGG